MSAPLLLLGGAALLLMSGKKKKSSSGSSRNFYDYSGLSAGDITPEKLSKIMSSMLTEKRVLAVVTDRTNKDLTNYVRDTMRWAASKRKDINFIIVDCNTDPDAEFSCPTEAWTWEFGKPLEPSTHIGRVDESFKSEVQKIVEG